MAKTKPNKKIDISVVIPAHNEEALLALCLKSILSQKFAGTYEIILIDNDSTDKTGQIARQFPIKVIREPKKGIAYARERGFREAKGEIIAST
ncbi:MAG: glycosyltransferase, partial [Patescibacteria group bacterium]|nr:glycosyltransferase [Patescibacteria group bacterium]